MISETPRSSRPDMGFAKQAGKLIRTMLLHSVDQLCSNIGGFRTPPQLRRVQNAVALNASW